jgi:anhydro-N-acetylmuramic acid kinase
MSRQPKPALALGIMSGTSIDSVDCALCEVTERTVALRRHWQTPFPAALRRRLHTAARGEMPCHELGQLHHDLGRFYVRAVRSGLGRDRPEMVGLHGQTVFHQPSRHRPATLQLGEPAWLVETLRIPVVSNFRAGDLAAGGQGAPLATLFHQMVFGRRGEFVCVNNLGGISNVTAVDWRRRSQPRVLAFDTGPANVLLDLAAHTFSQGRRHCDWRGAQAARGQTCESLLARWLRHRFFRQRPPKSTGRETFGEPFWAGAQAAFETLGLSHEDALATLTAFTARSIALNYRLHLGGRPDRVILTGGGAANPTLVRQIHEVLAAWRPGIQVLTSEALGWPLQSIEAAAFALLADRRLRALPGNLPATTGARRAALLGAVSAP